MLLAQPKRPPATTTRAGLLPTADNNTSVMQDLPFGQRGVVPGLLILSRDQGLIPGTAVLGAVFSIAGMHVTFAFTAGLVGVGLVVVLKVRRVTPLIQAQASLKGEQR